MRCILALLFLTSVTNGYRMAVADILDGQNKTIECPRGQTIQILRAEYGQSDSKPGEDKCGATITVTSNLTYCNGNRSCLIAPNQFTEDPCPGVKKYVQVRYQYVSQEGNTTTVKNRNKTQAPTIEDANTEEPKESTFTEGSTGIEDIVNLSYKGLKDADLQENLRNAITVNLSGNNIARLAKGILTKISSCQNLDLSNNKIVVIEGGIFNNLVHLKTLTLSGNPLQEISGDMWEGLRSLEVLEITNVSLTNVKPRGFANLKSLKTLMLNLNVFIKFKSRFMKPTSFPDTPRDQVKFRIELQGGREITCDNSLCFLNNMQDKGLIGGFTAQGEKIPEPICKLYQSSFWEYASLHCDNNNEKLPIQVNVSCANQLTFCFNSQNLSEFPSEKIPSNATTVQLSHNTISTLQNNSLTGLSNLVTLILSKNCIENIVPGAFLDQGKLKRLDLGGNNLTSLRGEIWVNLSSLEILRITGNKLQNLSPHAFNNLPKLKLLAVGFPLLVEQKQKLFDPNTFSNPTTQPQVALQQDEKTLICNSSNCWLKEKEDQGLLVHYKKNGWPFRPKCSDQPGLYWDQADLKCSGNTVLIVSIVGGVVGSIIFFAFCAVFIKCMCNRRRPKNEDNPVYQGGGPRPPRGMLPPIIIHDMRALEHRRQENLHAARERVRRRPQEEARQEERRLQQYPQMQPAQDHDQQPSVEVAVLPGACGYGAGCGQSNDQPDKGNAAAQCMPEQK